MLLGISSFIAVAVILLVLFLLQFYRNPERIIPEGSNIVSPADGKIIKILTMGSEYVDIEKGVLGKVQVLASDVASECVIVSIFMSPVDVHYNRAPISGVVKKVIHKRGKLLPASTFENGLQNEHTQILVQGKGIRVKVLQVAGFLARRIRCDVKEGQKVKKGERIGMIALGSQATLIMPSTVKLIVKEGQHVKAGSSVIAEIS
jgi:phosphatidylserine decarboxylase